MSDTPEWQHEVIIDSPVKVKMHYFGTEAEQVEENEVDLSPVRHGFKIGAYGFLVAEGAYAELINRPAICSLPDTPNSFLGFINHRGDTVPVYHLGAYFPQPEPAQGRWVLLIDQGSHCMGILITEAPERIREDWFKEPDSVEIPENLVTCLGKSFSRGLQVWTEFDHQTFCQMVKQEFHQG